MPAFVPPNLDSQRSWAWSREYHSHPNPPQNLQNFRGNVKAAYAAAENQTGMPKAYAVAYSNHGEVPHQYGTSAPHRNTGPPRPTPDVLRTVHEYRRQLAYPPNAHGEPSYVPRSLTAWRNTCSCAEVETVPRVVSESSHLLVYGVTVYSLTIGKQGNYKLFCNNCKRYAQTLADETPGLTVIDGATGARYESPYTVSSYLSCMSVLVVR
jgi:hypothetical protein